MLPDRMLPPATWSSSGTESVWALGDIANSAAGELAIAEVWQLPKVAPLVIDQGDLVYWDAADGNLNKTATDNTLAGFAFAGAASAATTVAVKINA